MAAAALVGASRRGMLQPNGQRYFNAFAIMFRDRFPAAESY
jgi:hypothetical protein